MARWRSTEPAHIEPPEWYRNYHPEAWDEPDAGELAMIEGSWLHYPECADGSPGWLEFHETHARHRWEMAKVEYRRQHPDLAEQEFAEIQARRAVRRMR